MATVRFSADGRFVVVDGRRRRAIDPGIPEDLRTELAAVLARARRRLARLDADPDATRRATDDDPRAWIADAQLALGQRGPAWWQDNDPDSQIERALAVIRTLRRARPSHIVPAKDVALVIAGRRWRRYMGLADVAISSEVSAAGTDVAARSPQPILAPPPANRLTQRRADRRSRRLTVHVGERPIDSGARFGREAAASNFGSEATIARRSSYDR